MRLVDPALLRASLRLVAISDSADDGVDGLVARVAAAVSGGATSVQVRLKEEPAGRVIEITSAIMRAVSVPVLVNDRFDLALAAGAAGVHLGADDLAPRWVRPHVPADFIIGVSVGCDSELEGARDADYVGIGPVFRTSSKPDAGNAIGVNEFQRLLRAGNRPAVGIGGITAANAPAVMAAGADGVAVLSALLAARDPAAAARALRLASGT